MDEIKSHHHVAREQPRCLALAVADAAMTSSDADTPVPKEMHQQQGPGDAPPVSPSILCAIAAASEGPLEFEIACRLFSEDAAEMRSGDRDAQGLLAHAIARAGRTATLLEWDDRIPSFDEVHAEALKANDFLPHAKTLAA